MLRNFSYQIMKTKSMISPTLWTYARLLILFAFFLISCKDNQHSLAKKTTKSIELKSPPPVFADVTNKAGLSGFQHDNGARGKVYLPEMFGSGGGFIDYDGDHWLDILLVGGGAMEADPARSIKALRLYKNNRNGTFTEVTEEAGLAGIEAYGQGINAVDYDNDGDEDIFFTTLHENFLLRNEGGTFSSVGKEAGLSGQAVWSSSSLFFDADRDGDLDLYVGNYCVWSPEIDMFCSVEGVIMPFVKGQNFAELEKQVGRKAYCPPNEFEGIAGTFYRNNGDGTFKDETEKAGFLPAPGKTLGVAEFDYNRDGWPDLVVANDVEADLLFKNNGDGTFKEIGVASGIAYGDRGEARAGMGIDVGVVDNSGQESIFVGNFSSEMIGVYKYKGNDLFSDRAASSKVGQPSIMILTFGLFLFDVEYDGDLDMMTANGHIWAIRPSMDGSPFRQNPKLFINNGEGTFADAPITKGSVFDQKMVARGASYGDYDRDGDLDVLLTENNGPVHLWRNDASNVNYLRVFLEGTKSNKEGISSQIIAVVDGQRMYRRPRIGSSYLSQSEKVVSFGLGESTHVDSLIVQWPSGQEDIFTDLKGNQEIKVIEGSKVFYALTTAP